MNEHIFTASSQADIVARANAGTLVSPYLAKVGNDYDYNTITAPTVTFSKTIGAFQTVVPVTCNVPVSGYGITTMDQTSWVRISTDSATTYADASAGITLGSGESTVYLILDGENTGNTAREQTIYLRFRTTPSATPEVIQEYTFKQNRPYSMSWHIDRQVDDVYLIYSSTAYDKVHHTEVTDPNGVTTTYYPGPEQPNLLTAETAGEYFVKIYCTSTNFPANNLPNGLNVCKDIYFDTESIANNTLSGSTAVANTVAMKFGTNFNKIGNYFLRMSPASGSTGFTLTFTSTGFTGTIGTQAFSKIKTANFTIHIPKGTRDNYTKITSYFTKATIVEDEPESPGE